MTSSWFRSSPTHTLTIVNFPEHISLRNNASRLRVPSIFKWEIDVLQKSTSLKDLSLDEISARDYTTNAVDFNHQIASQIQHTRWLIAPIRRLPEKVLIHIFRLCSSSSRIVLPFEKAGHGESDLAIIMTVCRFWRTLALSTESLWTKFSFIQRHAVTDEDTFLCNLVENRLSLSGTCPLRIHIDYDSNFPIANSGLALCTAHERWEHAEIIFHSGTTIRPISFAGNAENTSLLQLSEGSDENQSGVLGEIKLSILENYCASHERWENVNIISHDGTPNKPGDSAGNIGDSGLSQLLGSGENQFTALEELRLGILGNCSDSGPIKTFQNTPMLKRVILKHRAGSNISLPWHQVQDFTYTNKLEDDDRLDEQGNLFHNPKLKKNKRFSLHLPVIRPSNVKDNTEITIISSMKHLILESCVCERLSVHLQCPQLSSLKVRNGMGNVYVSIHKFGRFLSQASGLTSLELLRSTAVTAEIVSLLRFTPNLSSLYLQTNATSSTHFSFFKEMRVSAEFARSRKAVLLPKLTSLNLETKLDAVAQRAMLDMLESRRPPSLKSFYLNVKVLVLLRLKLLERGMVPVLRERLGLLRQGGLQMDLLDFKKIPDPPIVFT